MTTIVRPAAALLAAFFAVSAAAAAQAAGPIRVTSCEVRPHYAVVPGFHPGFYHAPYYWYDIYGYRYFQPPLAGHPDLAIAYRNESRVTATAIDFGLVDRGNLIAEVRDVGSFSPYATIEHQFGLDPNVYPIGSALYQCVPLRVEFRNGELWTNPHLPRLRRSIYSGENE